MRLSGNRKAATASSRRDELRRARAAAPTLRAACPAAAAVRVDLAFHEASGPAHAPQAFSIYPPGKAHFVYECPFGDCDGMYDLGEIALGVLGTGKRRARGTLTCGGHRARNGKSDNRCGLAATYSIVVLDGSDDAAPCTLTSLRELAPRGP
jgi:hypothetical protein